MAPEAKPKADQAPDKQPDKPADDPDAAPNAAEPGLANVGSEPENRDLGLPEPAAPRGGELTAGEIERQRVEDANAEADIGQTVIHDTAGNAVVTGYKRPVKAKDADASINEAGTGYSVATPIGIVTIGYETDEKGVQTVTVGTTTERDEVQHVADQVLLRSS